MLFSLVRTYWALLYAFGAAARGLEVFPAGEFINRIDLTLVRPVQSVGRALGIAQVTVVAGAGLVVSGGF